MAETLRRQDWLLPFENPLAKKFGADFFKKLPKKPGVYFMLGKDGTILYVGKAKDLRARLLSYRRAKPGRVSPKVIRLVHLLREIRWEECSSEKEALLRENSLLRAHRPPFNVLNTNPESYPYFCLGFGPGELRFSLTSDPDAAKEWLETGGSCFGAFKGRGVARQAYGALLRLLWISEASLDRFAFPARLARPVPPSRYVLPMRDAVRFRGAIESYWRGTSKRLLRMITEAILLNEAIPRFVHGRIQEDLETLEGFYEYGPRRNRRLLRSHARKEVMIPQEEIDDLMVGLGI